MARDEGSAAGMGRKRKHDEGAEGQTSPVKRSKSGKRERRRRGTESQTGPLQLQEDATLDGDDSVPKSKTKSAGRKERKRQQQATVAGIADKVPDDDTVLPEDAVDYNSSDEGEERRMQKEKAKKTAEHRSNQEQKKSKKKKSLQTASRPNHKIKRQTQWTLSGPAAGLFIDHDPVFVHHANGEDYLIAAVARELQVLSIETSLIVRTLPAPEGATITGFALESPESNLIHISNSKGEMSIWDWTNDLPAQDVFSSSNGMKGLVAFYLDANDDESKLAYIACADNVHAIKMPGKEMYTTQQTLNSLQVLGGAEYVVAAGPSAVVIGNKKENKSYTWIELPLSKNTTCSHARVLPAPPSPKKSTWRQHQLQLAVGNEDGQIHVYDDLSLLFAQGSYQPRLPAPRILHWHRTAVSSVKFSPDGNYLVSGGKETVLVLWQLQTGKKQYLPHLTSEIERITINPKGDRYALQMGDNSIMVLSTGELKPVANFAGLQMQVSDANDVQSPASALHPRQPKQLLLSVPATQPKADQGPAPRPFLQTFDLRTARHITRQALTRNNATDLNTGPEDNAILPPDVAHLAVSQGGEWLATVDEWMPPASGVEHLVPARKGLKEARCSRREVYLKIWHWDESNQLWTLSTRIDSPHHRADGQVMGAGRVSALSSDPVRNGFATLGEDKCVKIWKPKTRIRSGVAVKDNQDVESMEWTCGRSVHLSSNKDRVDSPFDDIPTHGARPAALAYSNDGSLLAVATSENILEDSEPAVVFIDTATGTIRGINSSFSDGSAITAIAFLDRYFISVTHQAAFLWNLVGDHMMHKIKLPHTPGIEPLLAVNEADQTFALVSPAENDGKRARVAVHTTRHTDRLYMQEFEAGVVKILSGKGSREFVLLFEDATIQTILPTGAAGSVSLPPLSMGPEHVEANGAADVDNAGDGAGAADLLAVSAVKQEDGGVPAFDVEEDDRPVVRPEQLAGIFDVGQSFAMQPVKDMFQAVVGLFGRRPQQAVA